MSHPESGWIVGYDPGGNGNHGVAVCEVRRDSKAKPWRIHSLSYATKNTLKDALDFVSEQIGKGRLLAVGVDTLTEWNTGPSGWRPADLYLRATYPAVQASVKAPNSLWGSMPLNGMGFIQMLRARWKSFKVTEAHPKVLYYAKKSKQCRHDWRGRNRAEMVHDLFTWLGIKGNPGAGDQAKSLARQAKDNAFDAVLCILPALKGENGKWTKDLHKLSNRPPEQIQPLGQTYYWWP